MSWASSAPRASFCHSFLRSWGARGTFSGSGGRSIAFILSRWRRYGDDEMTPRGEKGARKCFAGTGRSGTREETVDINQRMSPGETERKNRGTGKESEDNKLAAGNSIRHLIKQNRE